MKTDLEIYFKNVVIMSCMSFLLNSIIVKGEYPQEEKPWDGVLKTVFDFYVNLPSSGPWITQEITAQW